MFKDFSFPGPAPWLHRIWQDLQPTPERLSKALRMTFSSVLVLVLMLVLQMPYIAYGLYFIFLIGRESPSVSLRTAFASVVTISFVIVTEMGFVILSDNDHKRYRHNGSKRRSQGYGRTLSSDEKNELQTIGDVWNLQHYHQDTPETV